MTPLTEPALRDLVATARWAHAALTQMLTDDPQLRTDPYHLAALHTYQELAEAADKLLRHWTLTRRSHPKLTTAWNRAITGPVTP